LAAAPVGVITHHNAIKAHDARMEGRTPATPRTKASQSWAFQNVR